jgi:hypothetical protein
MRACHRIAVLLCCIATVSVAHADDVIDQITEALQAYQNHDTQTAITALDAASNLLRQSRADGLKRLLPQPPPGWTADAAESTAVSVAMLGGGVTASRAYHNGVQRVEVQIVADSPMLQSLAQLISSPLGAIGGMKTVVIGGRRMSYTENDRTYMALVADKMIVKIQGNADTPDPTLRSFIAAIDFAAIEKQAH